MPHLRQLSLQSIVSIIMFSLKKIVLNSRQFAQLRISLLYLFFLQKFKGKLCPVNPNSDQLTANCQLLTLTTNRTVT